MRGVVVWLMGGFLSLFSLVILKSISPDLVVKQFWFFVLGWLVCWVVVAIPERLFQTLIPWGYLGLNVILLILLFIGSATRGTVGWFELGGGLKFQPSQFAMPISALFLLWWHRGKRKLVDRDGWLALAIAAIPGLLILLEPDFGTSVVYFVSLGSLLWMLGIGRKEAFSVIGLGIVALVLAWFTVFKEYQKDRVLSFFDRTQRIEAETETSAAYNARQALTAVGSGGVQGRGLGQGVQSHLRFLPERQTDFIFASLAEETGFVGSMSVVVAYIVVIAWLFQTHRSLHGKFKWYLVGLGVFIFTQAGINIGMNIGLLPITGITLPLLSYGGSSILAICAALGIAMRQLKTQQVHPNARLK